MRISWDKNRKLLLRRSRRGRCILIHFLTKRSAKNSTKSFLLLLLTGFCNSIKFKHVIIHLINLFENSAHCWTFICKRSLIITSRGSAGVGGWGTVETPIILLKVELEMTRCDITCLLHAAMTQTGWIQTVEQPHLNTFGCETKHLWVSLY